MALCFDIGLDLGLIMHSFCLDIGLDLVFNLDLIIDLDLVLDFDVGLPLILVLIKTRF